MYPHKLLTAICLVITITASAQTGLYLKPSAGMGVSNIIRKEFTNNPLKRTGILSYNAGIAIGCLIKRFDISTGIQLLSTGFIHTDILFAYNQPIIEKGNIAYRYRHLMVPINVGYHIPISKRFAIAPQIGAAIAYTINSTSYLKTNFAESKQTTGFSQKSGYKRLNFFGSGQLNFEYVATRTLTVCVAPCFNYMLNSFEKAPANAMFDPNEHHYAASLNIGCMIHLSHLRHRTPDAKIKETEEAE